MTNIKKNLRDLKNEFKRPRGAAPSRPFARKLAEALLWTDEPASTRRLTNISVQGEVSQCFIGSQPAAIFVGHRLASPDVINRRVAGFAYHTSVEWGVVTNFVQTYIFNSHWVRGGDWFFLEPIRWSELDRHADLLQTLTPDGIREGKIDQIARRAAEPDDILMPVDDALVNRLDSWRGEALRHSEAIENLDEKLQTLFAQLFVLRTVEDRGLASRIPSLETALRDDGSADRQKIKRIFDLARQYIQSALFDVLPPEELPLFVIGGIIRDLYTPHHIGIQDVRYDFSWISTEVMGRAYEKYLSSVLIPARAVSPQLRLWEQPLREVIRVSRRKASGAYYTPGFIVHYLTHKCLEVPFDNGPRAPVAMPKVADFACGSGAFLTAAADSLIKNLRNVDSSKNWGRELVTRKCLTGIDIDPRAVTLARLSLWLRLAEEPNPLPLPRLENRIVCGDALTDDLWAALPKTYDVVLGNPPFHAAPQVKQKSLLARNFKAARGRFDYSYLFVELALKKLRKGGMLGLVIPNRLFTNRDACVIREVATTRANLLTLVDFGSMEVFSGTSSYVALLVARKRDHGADRQNVRFLKVKELPLRFLGALISIADDEAGDVRTPFITAYNARHPRGPHAWILLSQAQGHARLQLQEASRPLDEVARVVQGIKTGANDVFVVDLKSPSSSPICHVQNGLGDVHAIERACLKPVVFGSEIGRYDSLTATRVLVYPYHAKHLLTETELESAYPLTYAYLRTYRELLGARASIAGGRGAWYELVRQRDVSWLEAKKLVIRDLATEPSFAVDGAGGIFLVGGTAVVPADPHDLEALLGYLNSRLATWYLSCITPSFRSGFQKYEPRHFRELPILRVVTGRGRVHMRLTALVRRALEAHEANEVAEQRDVEEDIDSLLLGAVGINAVEVD